jgi:hypothetical protein
MTTLYQTHSYFCRFCGTIETIPENLDGIKLNQITKVICPKCLAKGKHHKMYKILKECGK